MSTMGFPDKRMDLRNGIFLSLAIHAFCIAGIMFFVATAARHQETVRLLLTFDTQGGGEIRQIKEEVKKIQSPPAARIRTLRSPSRQVRNLTPAKENAAVEPTKDAVPVADMKPSKESAPSNAVNSGSHESAAATAMAAAGGKGSGSGAGDHAGAGRGRESLENLRNRYRQEHFAYIRDLIAKNITYPPLAQKNGWQGKVKVSFFIKENGKVEGIKIVESSGFGILDRNLIETIREVQPFPKPPVRAELTIPFTYALRS